MARKKEQWLHQGLYRGPGRGAETKRTIGKKKGREKSALNHRGSKMEDSRQMEKK